MKRPKPPLVGFVVTYAPCAACTRSASSLPSGDHCGLSTSRAEFICHSSGVKRAEVVSTPIGDQALRPCAFAMRISFRAYESHCVASPLTDAGLDAKAMRVPSGAHAGSKPSASLRLFVPSAFIAQTSPLILKPEAGSVKRLCSYTICVPSGDHCGPPSATLSLVRRRRLAPLRLTDQI